MIGRSWRAARSLGLAALIVMACAPEEDPVSTVQPPRDAGGAALRAIEVPADSIDARSYPHAADFQFSDRVLFGTWEGLAARALISFDADAFLVFGGDTLTGSIVSGAELAYNCPGDQGPAASLPVFVRGVADAWEPDSLRWPGPALLPDSVSTILESCPPDSFFERTLRVPDELIESWIADPATNHGLAISAGDGAMFQMASVENLFLFPNPVGDPDVPGPRLRFSALRPQGDTTSVFLPASTIDVDTEVFSPDAADLPCADPGDCLVLGRGAIHRVIVRPDLPALPEGVNIHRAMLSLAVAGHPRFDRDLTVLVLRITSDWPDASVATSALDSMVTTSGVVWHQAVIDSGATHADIPITELVQAWYDGAYENRGLLLRLTSDGANVAAVAFPGTSAADPALRPRIEILYTRPYGGRP